MAALGPCFLKRGPALDHSTAHDCAMSIAPHVRSLDNFSTREREPWGPRPRFTFRASSLSWAYRLHGVGVAGVAERKLDPVSCLHLRKIDGRRHREFHLHRRPIDVSDRAVFKGHLAIRRIHGGYRPGGGRRLFCSSHGGQDAADALRRRIEEELRWDCSVPQYHDEVHLQ
jgi:hypothetical protein